MKDLLTDSSLSVGILRMALTMLPLFLGVMLLVWIVRFIRSLCDRLDSIEDKLELVLLHLESTKKSDGVKKDKSE